MIFSMADKEKLILMYRDFPLLSFEADYAKQSARPLKKLERFDKAPYGFDQENLASRLSRFFGARAIAPQRSDYQRILDATGCKNTFELSFKGHGLSLANHYWFKRAGENLRYDDINFFENKWDDSFGRAIINEDYDALKTCDLNVPDIVTPGWGIKAWIYDDGPKLYKFGLNEGNPEEAICEALASRLAKRMFQEGEYLPYELKMINGRIASVCAPLINVDEELIPLASVLPYDWYLIYKERNTANRDNAFFDKIKAFGLPGLYEFFVKVSCFRSVAFVSDLHFDNLSMVRNMNTHELRPAPLYDLGGAFGSSRTGKEMISKADKGTFLIIYFLFGGLDPNWDYSWYDPDRLIGFEEEIREYLSKSEFYTQDIINCVIDVYHQQKKTLDEMKRGSVISQ